MASSRKPRRPSVVSVVAVVPVGMPVVPPLGTPVVVPAGMEVVFRHQTNRAHKVVAPRSDTTPAKETSGAWWSCCFSGDGSDSDSAHKRRRQTRPAWVGPSIPGGFGGGGGGGGGGCGDGGGCGGC